MFSTRWGSTTNSTEWNSVSAKSVQTFLNLVYGQNLDRSLTKTVLFEVMELAHKYLVKVRCPVQFYQPLVRKHDGALHTTVAMAEKARSFGFDILQIWAAEQVLNSCMRKRGSLESSGGVWLDSLTAERQKTTVFLPCRTSSPLFAADSVLGLGVIEAKYRT